MPDSACHTSGAFSRGKLVAKSSDPDMPGAIRLR